MNVHRHHTRSVLSRLVIAGFILLSISIFALPVRSETALDAKGATPAEARRPGQINLLEYSPTGGTDRTGAADTSHSWINAITAANNLANAGQPVCIHVPAGRYKIVSPLPIFSRGGCIIGEGRWKTIIKLAPEFSGDLFAWDNTWIESGFPHLAATAKLNSQKLGADIEHLTIVGDRSALKQQNALVFYDHADFVSINDVDIAYLPGRAFYSGVQRDFKSAYMRESRITNFRAWLSGLPDVPVVEFTSQCTRPSCSGVDFSNEIEMDNIDIYGSFGPSLVLRNANTNSPLRDFRISKLRIEGTEHGETAADLMVIGDAEMPGKIVLVTISDGEWISPYPNHYSLHILSNTSLGPRVRPQLISVTGVMLHGANSGGGVRIDNGSDMSFHFIALTTTGTNVAVGPSPQTGAPLLFDGNGNEQKWTYDVHPTARMFIYSPARRQGIPNQ